MTTIPAREHLTCVRLNLLDARTAALNAAHTLPPGSRRNRAHSARSLACARS
jgi:hypothetical protein